MPEGHRLGILGTEVLPAWQKSTSPTTSRSNSFDVPHQVIGMVKFRRACGGKLWDTVVSRADEAPPQDGRELSILTCVLSSKLPPLEVLGTIK